MESPHRDLEMTLPPNFGDGMLIPPATESSHRRSSNMKQRHSERVSRDKSASREKRRKSVSKDLEAGSARPSRISQSSIPPPSTRSRGDNSVYMPPPGEEDHPPARQLRRLGTSKRMIGGDQEVLHTPIFIYTMIALNAGMFLYTMYEADWKFQSLSVNPTYGPSSDVLLRIGAKDTALIQEGEWPRLFLPMFLHGGLIHLFMNLAMMFRLGGSIEEAFGPFKTAMVYLPSGFVGILISAIFTPDTLGVGASGALYGLVGSLFGDFFQNHKTMEEGKFCYLFVMILSVAFGLVFGLLPVIDNFAHIGGLLMGFFMGSFLLVNTFRDKDGKRILPWYSTLLSVIGAIGAATMLIAGIAVLYEGIDPTTWCPGCNLLNCVDTKYWNCDAACVVTFSNGTSVVAPCSDFS